jgi:ABC-2 type transport system permease protein
VRKLLRGAFVIGRRDFSATVLSKTFLFFLLGPIFPLLFGATFGGIVGNQAAQRDSAIVAVIAPQAEFDRLETTREHLNQALGGDRLFALVRLAPQADVEAQQKALLAAQDPPRAVLTGLPDHPRLSGSIQADGTVAGQVRLLLTSARLPANTQPELIVHPIDRASASLTRDRARTGQVAQTALFFLTLLLSTMLLSQLVEEKSNKIIEVVAAAVPIESLFVGKLFAMLSASILGLIVWTSAGAAVVAWFNSGSGGLAALPVPAVGWPAFLGLTVVYFGLNYLLLGAVFLTIGAQASTVREVQTLSMPVTFFQVLIFGFATVAVGSPESGLAIAAAAFPLSSPLTMAALAAQRSEVWPHIAAIAWQILWVAIILRVGAGLFRKTVLKSGPARPWWRLGRV